MGEIKNPAGFWVRLAANFLDGLIFSAIALFITLFGIEMKDANEYSNALSGIYLLLIPIFWYGYTLGKKALGIKIKRVDGKKITFGTMILRNIVASVVYIVTFGIGLFVSAFMIALREDKRGLHDLIAGTYVGYDKEEVVLVTLRDKPISSELILPDNKESNGTNENVKADESVSEADAKKETEEIKSN